MDTTTNTATFITIKLDETESRLFLVDPKDVQMQVRQALATLAAKRVNGRKNSTLGKDRRNPKGPAAPAATKPSNGTKERVPCTICKKLLRPRSVGYHMRHNHPDAAKAETD